MTVQTIITQNGQFILTLAEVAAALGIPSTASIVSVNINEPVPGQITFVAVNPVSNVGTP